MSTNKVKPCTTGPKHSWQFAKNVSVGRIRHTANGSHGRFTLKGLYTCDCGATKYGLHDPNEPGDLRDLVSSMAGQTGGAA